MIHINPSSVKIIKAKRRYLQEMQVFVFRRIDKINRINSPRVERFFSNFINDYIDTILTGSPADLVKINNQINPVIEDWKELRQSVEYVFNYENFTSKKKKYYDAYNLAKDLDITICPYCNRNYTNTIINISGEKVARPTFDHYFDKNSNPLLAISFHNLVPSCSTCNSSVKGTLNMSLNSFLHPYVDDRLKDIQFTYQYSIQTNSGLEVKIKTPANSKAHRTVEAFALEPIYNAHTSELLDLIKTKQYFSDRYLEILSSNLLEGLFASKEDLYRMVFGSELHERNFAHRPFSKFKHDILTELGII